MDVLNGQHGMKVVRGSFSEPTKAAYNTASGMLLSHPDMQATWVAWDTVAQQVVAAERAQNRRIYIATVDLGAISALLMAEGYIHAIGAQQPYNQGVAEADAAAYALLGKEVPPYLELPTVPVTIETLLPAYKIVMHTDAPPSVVTAIKRTAGIEPQV
jgi:ribose transport system substrate-binding protein